VTHQDGSVYNKNIQEGIMCNEFLVDQESQILPAFIILLDKQICKSTAYGWEKLQINLQKFRIRITQTLRKNLVILSAWSPK